MVTGVVRKYAAHHSRGEGKEVRPALPGNRVAPAKPHVGLVHENRGLKGMTGALRGHAALSNSVQLEVHMLEQLRLCGAVATRQPVQEKRNFTFICIRHFGIGKAYHCPG